MNIPDSIQTIYDRELLKRTAVVRALPRSRYLKQPKSFRTLLRRMMKFFLMIYRLSMMLRHNRNFLSKLKINP